MTPAPQASLAAAPTQPPRESSPPEAAEPLPKSEPSRLGTWKDVTAVIQSIATVLGILAAGWWFFNQGTLAPHADLSQSVQTLDIHPNWRLVRLSVTLKNVGAVPVSLKSGRVYIARVLPLEDAIRKRIDSGYTPIDADTQQVPWPSIGKPYQIELDSEIWPGESESYNFDFMIPTDLCEVMLYSELASQPNRHLHWDEQTLQKVGDCHDQK